MKWQKDLEAYFSLYNSFILEGYIDDIQPYEEDGVVKYCTIDSYLTSHYGQYGKLGHNKRVIIYDPTEAEDRRFNICDTPNVVEGGDNGRSSCAAGGEQSASAITYSYDSMMSQRFYDITNRDLFNDLLISHSSSGTTLDFAQIHYAVTEGIGRLHDNETPEALRDMFMSLFRGEIDENEPDGYLFVVKMASRLLTHNGGDSLSGEELVMFRQLLNIALSIDEINKENPRCKSKLIILANEAKDLPSWFIEEDRNSAIKTITVSKPSEDNRTAFFNTMVQDMLAKGTLPDRFVSKYFQDVPEQDRAQFVNKIIVKKFLAYSNDFTMTMLKRYGEYFENNPIQDPDKIGFSLTTFRTGDMTNPWENRDIIRDMLYMKDRVEKKIKGQSHALKMVQNILTRSVIGLDRAENPNAPRAVLFLAGPTGTGKTEVCKQIAECVFGSEDRIVRLDMSEYGKEESDQKMFGAPPGYVGYREGGKLTNAVKKEPFSLVLFDEIEKAHPSILDKFLQILGDGRLTDGRGDTVRFTDCIIVITSNAGVSSFDDIPQDTIDNLMGGAVRPEVEMDMAEVLKLENENYTEDEIYALVREHLRYNVMAYFKCKLRRPELYGRIEDAIVYYNYISRAAVPRIANSKIDDVIVTSQEEKGIAEIICPDDVRDKIVQFCQSVDVRESGARGIIKSTGLLFSGSLSNFIGIYVAEGNDEELEGKTLTCSCTAEIIVDSSDIVWSIV